MTHYRSLVQTYWCDSLSLEQGSCNNSFEAEGLSSVVWSSAHRVGWRREQITSTVTRHVCPEHAIKA